MLSPKAKHWALRGSWMQLGGRAPGVHAGGGKRRKRRGRGGGVPQHRLTVA